MLAVFSHNIVQKASFKNSDCCHDAATLCHMKFILNHVLLTDDNDENDSRCCILLSIKFDLLYNIHVMCKSFSMDIQLNDH